jgi:hypothetical protein
MMEIGQLKQNLANLQTPASIPITTSIPNPITTTSQSAPTFSTVPGVKVQAPEKFSGNTKDQTIEIWLTQMNLFFRMQGITTDEQQVLYSMNLLTGGASHFMQDYYDRSNNGQPLGTYLDFKNKLLSCY